MNRPRDTNLAERLPLASLREVFEQRGVRIALCFGSYASGETHDRSDVDIAVEFDNTRPGEERYSDSFFELYRDVATVLDTENVDIVDVHSLSGSMVCAVFDHGVLLYGDAVRAETLREQLAATDEKRPPRRRLDEAIERIDENIV